MSGPSSAPRGADGAQHYGCQMMNEPLQVSLTAVGPDGTAYTGAKVPKADGSCDVGITQ